MGIVSTQQTLEASSSINEKFEVEYSRQYQILTNSVTDSELYVRTNCGISLFSAYPGDAFARCKSVTARRVCNGYFDDATGFEGSKWLVDVTWGYINPFEASPSGNPTEATIEVVIEGIDEEKAADEDINGAPVVNSAGDYFDPPAVRDETRLCIKIARNEENISAAQIFNLANKVNTNAWQGLDAKTVLIKSPRITPHFSMLQNVIYYRVEYTMYWNPDGWKKKVVDQGYRQLDPSDGTKRQIILDEFGVPASSPYLLDGNGKALAPPVNKDNVKILEFDIYQDIDFDSLGFPDNMFVSNPS